MPPVSFETLVPRVQSSVLECPYPTIVAHIKDAAIRACERTLYWRYKTPIQTLTPNVNEYDYLKPIGTDVHAVFGAIINEKYMLQSLTMEDAIRYDNSNKKGAPQIIYQITPNRFRLIPIPDDTQNYDLYMYLALKPSRDATEMEDVIMHELEDVIVHNALQHLFAIPNTRWENHELAAYHAKQYIYQTAERRARANLGNMRGMLKIKPRPFGA